jgi:hypothetical protein
VRTWAHPCHVCAGTGLAAATSAPGLGSLVPRLHQDRARRCDVGCCAAKAFCCPRLLARLLQCCNSVQDVASRALMWRASAALRVEGIGCSRAHTLRTVARAPTACRRAARLVLVFQRSHATGPVPHRWRRALVGAGARAAAVAAWCVAARCRRGGAARCRDVAACYPARRAAWVGAALCACTMPSSLHRDATQRKRRLPAARTPMATE